MWWLYLHTHTQEKITKDKGRTGHQLINRWKTFFWLVWSHKNNIHYYTLLSTYSIRKANCKWDDFYSLSSHSDTRQKTEESSIIPLTGLQMYEPSNNILYKKHAKSNLKHDHQVSKQANTRQHIYKKSISKNIKCFM